MAHECRRIVEDIQPRRRIEGAESAGEVRQGADRGADGLGDETVHGFHVALDVPGAAAVLRATDGIAAGGDVFPELLIFRRRTGDGLDQKIRFVRAGRNREGAIINACRPGRPSGGSDEWFMMSDELLLR